MHSDYHNDSEQDLFRKKLARLLGLSFDELEEFAEEVEPNNGDMDRDKFGYYLQFSEATPAEITDKIKRLDRNNRVFFNLDEIDSYREL